MSDTTVPLIDLDQRANAIRWHIAGTVAMGGLAAGLALYGQDSLEQARPIFPVINQNFGLWQAAYVLVLLVMALVWAAAMRQRCILLQDCLRRRKMLQVIIEQKELRARRKEQARLEREREREQAQEKPLAGPAFGARTKSSKFDY